MMGKTYKDQDKYDKKENKRERPKNCNLCGDPLRGHILYIGKNIAACRKCYEKVES